MHCFYGLGTIGDETHKELSAGAVILIGITFAVIFIITLVVTALHDKCHHYQHVLQT